MNLNYITGGSGQDPGFSNRWGATSHTHMWVWLRFCIAAIYCFSHHPLCTCSLESQDHSVNLKSPGFESQLKVKRGRDHPHHHPPSGSSPALASLFVPDIMHSKVMLCLSTEYQACSGLWWCEVITGPPPISASVLRFSKQLIIQILQNPSFRIFLRYQERGWFL